MAIAVNAAEVLPVLFFESNRRSIRWCGGAIVALASLAAASCGGSGSVTSPSPVAITVTGTGATSYTYTTNIRPILTTDCASCHNASQHQAGLDLTTYAGVMRAVTAGSDASVLVQVTQPGGLMYSQLTGDRNGKAGIIYDWVVHSGAAQ